MKILRPGLLILSFVFYLIYEALSLEYFQEGLSGEMASFGVIWPLVVSFSCLFVLFITNPFWHKKTRESLGSISKFVVTLLLATALLLVTAIVLVIVANIMSSASPVDVGAILRLLISSDVFILFSMVLTSASIAVGAYALNNHRAVEESVRIPFILNSVGFFLLTVALILSAVANVGAILEGSSASDGGYGILRFIATALTVLSLFFVVIAEVPLLLGRTSRESWAVKIGVLSVISTISLSGTLSFNGSLESTYDIGIAFLAFISFFIALATTLANASICGYIGNEKQTKDSQTP